MDHYRLFRLVVYCFCLLTVIVLLLLVPRFFAMANKAIAAGPFGRVDLVTNPSPFSRPTDSNRIATAVA